MFRKGNKVKELFYFGELEKRVKVFLKSNISSAIMDISEQVF